MPELVEKLKKNSELIAILKHSQYIETLCLCTSVF